MQNGNGERSCLFCTDVQSGKRKVAEHILPGSIIGFMNATPWCGQSRDHRRTNAMERINHFVGSIQTAAGGNTPLLAGDRICSYASPEEINIEDKWTRIAKSRDLEDYQKKFVEKHLLPLVSSSEEGMPKRISTEQAKKNMRLTLVGFSYGGMFIGGVRKELIQAMTALGYKQPEIKEIFSQVYQVNFGVQCSEYDKIEPRFHELKLVTRDDNQGIWESLVDQSEKFVMLDNPSSVTRDDGKVMTKPHSQEMYMQSLMKKPELCKEIAGNIIGESVQPTRQTSTSEEAAYIKERLGVLSYRLQMMRRD